MKVQGFETWDACDALHGSAVYIRRECCWRSEYVDITNLDMRRANLAMVREEKAKLYWRRRHIEERELIHADAFYTCNSRDGYRGVVNVDGDTD